MRKMPPITGALAMLLVLSMFCGVLSLPKSSTPVFCEVETSNG